MSETQAWLVHHQIAYVHSLRQHLRGLPPLDRLDGLLSETEMDSLQGEKNVPLSLQLAMARRLRDCLDRHWINPLVWQAIDRNLDDLADAQGGLERIKNTPLPKQYDSFPQLFVQTYCILLPMGLVETLGWYTPIGSTIVGFMFLALDKIGRDLENPFENSIHDLPLNAITTTIETNLRQMLGEAELPPAATPEQGVLW